MPSRHHRPTYRITAIFLAFLLFGAAVFVPLGVQKEPNVVLLVVLGVIWFLALTGTIVANEIYIRKKYGGDFLSPQKDDEDDR